MKAIVWTAYGAPDVLQLQEIVKPTPKDNEVLIRIRASTVTAGDVEMRKLSFPLWLALPLRLYAGIRRPHRITSLGQELAGEVEAVGKSVTKFSPGDAVFGSTGFGFGGYAEYICLPENRDDAVLELKPENMSFEEAAAVPTGGLEALHFLRKATIQPGQTVLINGAGGTIGTFGVQLAKHYGAEVTGVDKPEKFEMLRGLGADHCIDYTREDFSQRAEKYDVILDVIGKGTFGRCMRALKPDGCYLVANSRLSQFFRSLLIRLSSNKRIVFATTTQSSGDLLLLRELIEAGDIKTVIDRTFSLEQAADAHRYVETGGKVGNVIISVG